MNPVDQRMTHAALASTQRVALLDIIRSQPDQVDALTLAKIVGLHVTTVRFHLDELLAAQLIERIVDRPAGRGRPRYLFRPTPADSGENRHFQDLAAVLVANWSDAGSPRDRADAAGRQWARLYASPDSLDSPRAVVSDVSQHFNDLGFATSVESAGDDFRILFRNCPYFPIAEQFPQVVCQIHQGLIRGMLNDRRTDAAATVIPWAEAGVCVAHISPKQPVA